jgi:hypothetical protein
VKNTAVFSADYKYRYSLTRELISLPRQAKKCLFIMLNPSTADACTDDPTIRRCISFASREHCSSLTVCNLFAFRSTDPKKLSSIDDPTRADNLKTIVSALSNHDLVIVAFGAHKMAKESPVWRIIKTYKPMFCLGKTKSNLPRHPLYVKKDQPLELF